MGSFVMLMTAWILFSAVVLYVSRPLLSLLDWIFVLSCFTSAFFVVVIFKASEGVV